MLLHNLILNNLLNQDKTAILYYDNEQNEYISLSYHELYNVISNLISYLLKQGINFKDTIIVSSTNNLEFALIFLASLFLNLTIVPLPQNTPKEFLEKVKNIIFSDIILNEKYLKHIKSQIDDWKKTQSDFLNNFLKRRFIDASKPYIITFSSGSTGDPKPITFSQNTKLKRIFLSLIKYFNLHKESNIMFVTPLYHSLAQRFLLTPLVLGSTCIFMKKYNLENFLEISKQFNISLVPLVSTQVEDILSLDKKELLKLPFKYVLSSSNTLRDKPRETYLNIKNAVNFELFETYGTSELGFVSILSLKKESKKYKSVGKPLPYVKVKIDGNKIGEILCKSETLFEGYYKRNDLNKKYFTKDGYFRTGDLGYLDEDGYLYFKGRKKDVIISGGINIYPEDIEKIIKQYPRVEEAVVFGYPHSRLGEIICAVIKPKEKLTKLEIYNYLKNKLLHYQIPHVILFAKDIPKTALGKYSRINLKKLYSKEIERWSKLM